MRVRRFIGRLPGLRSLIATANLDDATDSNDILYLIGGADRFSEYKRVNTPVHGVGTTYKAVNGASGVFKYEAGAGSEPDTYTLHDQEGNEIVFFGFDADSGVAAGQLWKITDMAGNVAYVGNSSTASTAISSGYDASGRMTTAYDSAGRKYTYTYTQLDSVYRLTQVKAEKNTGSWVMVAQADYAYYSNESYGDIGDLKQVTITTPMSVGLAESPSALTVSRAITCPGRDRGPRCAGCRAGRACGRRGWGG